MTLPKDIEQLSKATSFRNRRFGVMLILHDPRHDGHLLQRDPFAAFDQLVRNVEKNINHRRGIARKEIFHGELAWNKDSEAAAE